MQMVDSLRPFAGRAHRVSTADEQVTGIEAQSDRSQLEHLLDLPLGLDPRSALVVESRLVAALAAARSRHFHSVRKALPALGVETEAVVLYRAAGRRAASIGSDGRQRGPWFVGLAAYRVKNVKKHVQRAHRGPHAVRVVEGQLEEAARQPKPAPPKISRQLGPFAEVPDRAKIDACIAGVGHLVQDHVAARDVGVDTDRELECPITDRRVRDDDFSARFLAHFVIHTVTVWRSTEERTGDRAVPDYDGRRRLPRTGRCRESYPRRTLSVRDPLSRSRGNGSAPA